jgi:hypothetical protein
MIAGEDFLDESSETTGGMTSSTALPRAAP